MPLAKHERLAGKIPSQYVKQHAMDNNCVYFYNTVKVMRHNPHPISHVSLHQEGHPSNMNNAKVLALARKKIAESKPQCSRARPERGETPKTVLNACCRTDLQIEWSKLKLRQYPVLHDCHNIACMTVTVRNGRSCSIYRTAAWPRLLSTHTSGEEQGLILKIMPAPPQSHSQSLALRCRCSRLPLWPLLHRRHASHHGGAA